MNLLTLHAVHPETGEALVCCMDLKKLEEANRLFTRFSRYLSHKGYVLCSL